MARHQRNFAFWHECILAILLLAISVWIYATEPNAGASFLSWSTQTALLDHIWELALLAIPMTLIILTGGIDLSVGSTMALSAVVLGFLYRSGVPVGWSAACALLIGVICGAFNGLFVVRLQVHPLIVTLASFAAFRGIAEGSSAGESVSRFPESFRMFAESHRLGLPIAGWIFVVMMIGIGLGLRYMAVGRYVYAIGYNETASRLSGINVDRIKLGLYAFSGMMAGLAAIHYVARRDAAKADVGEGIELDVITAVVLGGTSIFGGRGNLWGTILGILLVHETREFVTWRWNQSELYLIVIGILLIGSVLLNRLVSSDR